MTIILGLTFFIFKIQPSHSKRDNFFLKTQHNNLIVINFDVSLVLSMRIKHERSRKIEWKCAGKLRQKFK